METTGKLIKTGEKMTFLLSIRRREFLFLERGIIEFGLLK